MLQSMKILCVTFSGGGREGFQRRGRRRTNEKHPRYSAGYVCGRNVVAFSSNFCSRALLWDSIKAMTARGTDIMQRWTSYLDDVPSKEHGGGYEEHGQ